MNVTFRFTGARQAPFAVLALITLLAPAAAVAHDFTLLMLIGPATDTAVQEDMRTAVLIASEERDGHANQTSDGHLGGLDVHLALLSPARTTDRPAPDILAAPLPGTSWPEGLFDIPRLGPPDPASAPSQAFLAQAADPAYRPFAARFRDRTGREPGPQAVAAYLSARRIDAAVRALAGVSDPVALAALLDG